MSPKQISAALLLTTALYRRSKYLFLTLISTGQRVCIWPYIVVAWSSLLSPEYYARVTKTSARVTRLSVHRFLPRLQYQICSVCNSTCSTPFSRFGPATDHLNGQVLLSPRGCTRRDCWRKCSTRSCVQHGVPGRFIRHRSSVRVGRGGQMGALVQWKQNRCCW